MNVKTLKVVLLVDVLLDIILVMMDSLVLILTNVTALATTKGMVYSSHGLKNDFLYFLFEYLQIFFNRKLFISRMKFIDIMQSS